MQMPEVSYNYFKFTYCKERDKKTNNLVQKWRSSNVTTTFVNINSSSTMKGELDKFNEIRKKNLHKAATERFYRVCSSKLVEKQKALKDWRIRVTMTMQETELDKDNTIKLKYPYTYMVLLTYDDDHVPTNDKNRMTLNKKDVTLFLKRLRKANMEIKYIIAGEYGSDTYRPHLHALIFSKQPIKLNENQRYITKKFKTTYKAPFLCEKWGKGFVNAALIQMNETKKAVNYVLKYMLKQQIKKKDKMLQDVEKEFCLFSKGLGLSYYNSHKEQLFQDFDPKKDPSIFTFNGETKKIPKYFIYRLKKDDEEKYETFKLTKYIYVCNKGEPLYTINDIKTRDMQIRQNTIEPTDDHDSLSTDNEQIKGQINKVKIMRNEFKNNEIINKFLEKYYKNTDNDEYFYEDDPLLWLNFKETMYDERMDET